MYRTSVVIIGAGQAGLAVSNLLTAASVDHVVFERGRIAESWRSRRWDSLRLLTPNWMTRLPGWPYVGRDPGGFMSAGSAATMLERYAASYAAPVIGGTTVESVRHHGGAFTVITTSGSWTSRAVVVATGHAAESKVPGFAASLERSVRQITPDRYRNPVEVPGGRVLVVGASATGVQIADELRAAGREVVLSVGRHTRVPRRYRGMDIMWWLDSIGALDRGSDPADRPRPAERSLQLIGSESGREVDLDSLSLRGVELIGRVDAIEQGIVHVADDLGETRAAADAKLDRLLQRIDAFAIATGLHSEVEPASRPEPPRPAARSTSTPPAMGLSDIGSVVWATGYRRRYPWLQVPVLDPRGEIAHAAGRTRVHGLVVVGMAWQTRRTSTFIDGVGHDAALVVDHLLEDVLGTAHLHRDAS